MNVLVACEESQEVCKAFRARGHRAFSCDIQECSGGHPEWHIKDDVLAVLYPDEWRGTNLHLQSGHICQIFKWDLIIAHPPCTYMSAAGACRMYPKAGHIDEERFAKAMDAKRFFMDIRNAPCQRICIENPRPLKCVELPKETQRIQPYEFGEPWSKLTYLWLKGLPPLVPTQNRGGRGGRVMYNYCKTCCHDDGDIGFCDKCYYNHILEEKGIPPTEYEAKPKPMTNADKLRAMTDEELAKILYEVWISCGRFMGDRECKGDCEKCWLEWLKEEECECCFKRVLDRMNQEEE